jgi:hypothetical protein
MGDSILPVNEDYADAAGGFWSIVVERIVKTEKEKRGRKGDKKGDNRREKRKERRERKRRNKNKFRLHCFDFD